MGAGRPTVGHGGCNEDCQQDDCKPCRFPKPRDSHPFPRPDSLDVDYGEPVAGSACAETSPGSGIWQREWTKARVQLNCNDYTSKITMK